MGAEASSPNGQRVDFLDGIRGLAALYVVLFHFWQAFMCYGARPAVLETAAAWMSAGRSAVTVFIVLSGFCLMMPLVRNGELRGGVGGFLLRRAKRILPPYFAALVLALAFLAHAALLMNRPENYGYRTLPAWERGAVCSHFLLVHNLSDDWVFKIATPFWSVATEWQIYFVFALVLLPIWRRLGMTVTVGLALALGLLMPTGHPAAPWLLACFALGMGAAQLSLVRYPRLEWIPWRTLAALGIMVSVGVLTWCVNHDVRSEDYQWRYLPALDYLVGATTACGLVACARRRAGASVVRRFLEARRCRELGAFSYSLYLIHGPLVCALDGWTHAAGFTPLGRLAIFMFGGVPVCLLLAHGFYCVFERPFAEQKEIRQAPSPALQPPHRAVTVRGITAGMSRS